ncbi:hypothetical protein [Kitasatospora sp. MMS16-BH015]|uniref:RipA family octameric membrane protein n=1 Tax=Kitasatospora sp. MMS16-BH015 TaxID=2018025 RepID=UPI000CF2E1A6|nr:hypothetical protein [Kitasatospora sp. MMS16-BH015]
MTGMDDALWNEAVTAADYARNQDKYQGAVLEQYKLCVEMADRVSSRRNLTNTFFLTLNTAVVAALAAVSADSWAGTPVWSLVAGLLILLAQCLVWYVMMRSYRQLSAAKWAVIGAMERRLPAFAYSEAEWTHLGEGKDWRKYIRLTYAEQAVPVIAAVAYLVGFLAAVL